MNRTLLRLEGAGVLLTAVLLYGAAGGSWVWFLLLQGALVWTAHIGMDRMLGYGLKYTAGFKETHLSHI